MISMWNFFPHPNANEKVFSAATFFFAGLNEEYSISDLKQSAWPKVALDEKSSIPNPIFIADAYFAVLEKLPKVL